MKKAILFFGVTGMLLQCATVSTAQTTDLKKLRFGAFLSPTMSWMRPTANKSDDGMFNTKNNGYKMGFTYGLMAEYRFAENYSIATGVQINMTGGRILADRVDKTLANDMDSMINVANFNYSLNYIEIPVGLKMRTNFISGFRFFGQVGITTGLNIAKKATYDIDYAYRSATDPTVVTNPSKTSEENIKLRGTWGISPVLFQMNIGGGAEYPLNDQLSAYIGVFYNNGFAPDVTNPTKYNLNYSNNQMYFKDGNTRLNNIAIKLGLFF